MANGNAPRGLIPLKHKNGAPFNNALTLYYVPASDTNNIFIGDPVIVNGTGDAAGNPGCILATAGAGNFITGVVCGVPKLASNDIYTGYRAASTAAYVLVCDDPSVEYLIQEDSVGGANAITDISSNVDLIAGAGSTYTNASGWLMDSSTVGTGATKQLRILSLLQSPDNAIGQYAKWLVKLNVSSQTNTTGV